MRLLTEEKFDIFKEFVLKLLHANLSESKIFTHHEVNYLFKFGFERSENRMGFDKVLLEFEYSSHYLELYSLSKFYMRFYELDNDPGIKRLRIRYNKDTSVYNNTVLNFNINNLNKLFRQTNSNLSKNSKQNPDIQEILDFDIENLIHMFEKKLMFN